MRSGTVAYQNAKKQKLTHLLVVSIDKLCKHKPHANGPSFELIESSYRTWTFRT